MFSVQEEWSAKVLQIENRCQGSITASLLLVVQCATSQVHGLFPSARLGQLPAPAKCQQSFILEADSDESQEKRRWLVVPDYSCVETWVRRNGERKWPGIAQSLSITTVIFGHDVPKDT